MLRKKGIALAISLAFPAASFALGLGAMKTSSQLSQPFSARIELLGATAGELDDIAVKLADASQFQRAGLVLNAQLLALRFEVVNDPKGDYIKVFTRGPVNEPVLDFIVELRSPTGTILREYAVLLDPPSYAMRSRPAARQQAPAPASSQAAVTAAAPAAPMPAAIPAPMPAPPVRPRTPPPEVVAAALSQPLASPARPPKAAAPRPAPAARPPAATKPKAPSVAAATAAPAPMPTPPPEPLAEGEVALKSNESLWEVAKRYRPSPSVSVPQMMIAIQRANPEAFPDNNVRNIRPGATLAIPDEESIASVSEAEADAEVQRQVARWRERRLAIASRPAPQAKPASAQEQPAAPVKQAAEAPTPTGTDGPDARLEIVAPGTKSGSKPATESALRDEHAAALASEMAELRARLDEAAGIIDLLENQVKLKNEELTRLKQPTPAAQGQGAAVTSASTAAGDSATPAEPAAVTVPGTPPTAAKPALQAKDDIIPALPEESPLIPAAIVESVPGGWLGLGGALAALLAGVGLVARRRLSAGDRAKQQAPAAPAKPSVAAPARAIVHSDQTSSPDAEPPTSLGARLRSLLAPLLAALRRDRSTPAPAPREDALMPNLQVMTAPPLSPVAAAAAALAPMPMEADPLEEVNIYLAYERFDQAEELVRKVISESPENPDYRLRLLEVLQAAGKATEFEQSARELRGLVDEDDPRWAEACAFWREFETGRELLAGATANQPAQAVSTPPELLESTQTGLMRVDDELGLKAEEALDELDALLGGGKEPDQNTRDLLQLDAPPEAESVAPAPAERTAPTRGLSSATSPARNVAVEALAPTELDFDLGGMDLGATGEVDIEVQARAKAAEAAVDLDLELEPAAEPDLGATLPPAALASVAEAASLDLDLDLGAPDEPAQPTATELTPSTASTVFSKPAAAEVVTEIEDFDLSLEGDLAASLDLAAELGLKSAVPAPVQAEPPPPPVVAPLPPAMLVDDLDLSLDIELESAPALALPESPKVAHGFDLELELVDDDLSPEALLQTDSEGGAAEETPADGDLSFALDDETDTKLNLAKAYIELGETEAARSILAEVVSEGEPSQQAEARQLLSQIG